MTQLQQIPYIHYNQTIQKISHLIHKMPDIQNHSRKLDIVKTITQDFDNLQRYYIGEGSKVKCLCSQLTQRFKNAVKKLGFPYIDDNSFKNILSSEISALLSCIGGTILFYFDRHQEQTQKIIQDAQKFIKSKFQKYLPGQYEITGEKRVIPGLNKYIENYQIFSFFVICVRVKEIKTLKNGLYPIILNNQAGNKPIPIYYLRYNNKTIRIHYRYIYQYVHRVKRLNLSKSPFAKKEKIIQKIMAQHQFDYIQEHPLQRSKLPYQNAITFRLNRGQQGLLSPISQAIQKKNALIYQKFGDYCSINRLVLTLSYQSDDDTSQFMNILSLYNPKQVQKQPKFPQNDDYKQSFQIQFDRQLQYIKESYRLQTLEEMVFTNVYRLRRG